MRNSSWQHYQDTEIISSGCTDFWGIDVSFPMHLFCSFVLTQLLNHKKAPVSALQRRTIHPPSHPDTTAQKLLAVGSTTIPTNSALLNHTHQLTNTHWVFTSPVQSEGQQGNIHEYHLPSTAYRTQNLATPNQASPYTCCLPHNHLPPWHSLSYTPTTHLPMIL